MIFPRVFRVRYPFCFFSRILRFRRSFRFFSRISRFRCSLRFFSRIPRFRRSFCFFSRILCFRYSFRLFCRALLILRLLYLFRLVPRRFRFGCIFLVLYTPPPIFWASGVSYVYAAASAAKTVVPKDERSAQSNARHNAPPNNFLFISSPSLLFFFSIYTRLRNAKSIQL